MKSAARCHLGRTEIKSPTCAVDPVSWTCGPRGSLPCRIRLIRIGCSQQRLGGSRPEL